MADVFADACFWIARLNKRDALHEIALLLSETVDPGRIVTSELVLGEVLNFFAELGPHKRRAAVALARELHDSPDVEVVILSDVRFWDTVDFLPLPP